MGAGVYHLAAGDRVFIDPHLVADEWVAEPAQILLGLTAMGSTRFGGISDATKALQSDWPDGTFTQVSLVPAGVLTKMPKALDAVPAERGCGGSRGVELPKVALQNSAPVPSLARRIRATSRLWAAVTAVPAR